ncbi:MAG: hypothetical protein ACRD2D_06810, partial [Terriglobales bacterium]
MAACAAPAVPSLAALRQSIQELWHRNQGALSLARTAKTDLQLIRLELGHKLAQLQTQLASQYHFHEFLHAAAIPPSTAYRLIAAASTKPPRTNHLSSPIETTPSRPLRALILTLHLPPAQADAIRSRLLDLRAAPQERIVHAIADALLRAAPPRPRHPLEAPTGKPGDDLGSARPAASLIPLAHENRNPPSKFSGRYAHEPLCWRHVAHTDG